MLTRKSESMEGAGNDIQFCRHSGPDEAASVFHIFLEKEIEPTDGYEYGG